MLDVWTHQHLIIAKRAFEIMEVALLMVGHTHEDIDGTYEILLALLK